MRWSTASSPCPATAWWITRAVFRALPGYSGWVIVEAEQDPAKANPLIYARLGRANLARFLSDAGLKETT